MSKDPGNAEQVYWADVAVAYQRAIRSFDEFVRPVLREFGLPGLGVSQVLFLINIGDGERRVSELVRQERYAGSNASYALSSLVECGLVARSLDERDRRVRVVSLTPTGQALLKAIRNVSVGKSGAIGAALSTVSEFETHCARLPA